MIRKVFLFGFSCLYIIALIAFKPISIHSDNNSRMHYKAYCASCHGENLKSFVDRTWLYGNSWNEVFQSIKFGFPDDGMSAYDTTFTDKEIGQLVDYIMGGLESLTTEDFEVTPDYSGIMEAGDQKFRIDTVVSGLGIPWGLDFIPDGGLLITQRSGELTRVSKDGKKVNIANVPEVSARGQGGMLDVAVHPDFGLNQWIYLSYSKPKGKLGTTAIVRAKLKEDRLTEQEILVEATPFLSTRHHYGSRIVFARAGYLYFSVGDRGRRDENPQSLDNHCGKIHRIYDDGRIPQDNPFVNTPGAIPTIYSYGHRNPQGLDIHPITGELWANEHGPRGGDEVNRIRRGKNYGWPVISYGINYNGTTFTDLTSKPGMEQPEHYWVPSIGVCGMAFISGNHYPAWRGGLLSGSLAFQYLSLLKFEDGKIIGEEKLLRNIGRLREVKMGPDGYIYFTVENPGYVLRILPEDV